MFDIVEIDGKLYLRCKHTLRLVKLSEPEKEIKGDENVNDREQD